MNELQAALRIALANTFVMYFQSHAYHWNVEGLQFPAYHDFFGDLYDELYGAVDPLAEHLRAIDGYAPCSLADIISETTIREDQSETSEPVLKMLGNLLSCNNEVIASLNKAFSLAAGNNGLQNFLADRLDIHAKHGWQLKASQKTLGAY